MLRTSLKFNNKKNHNESSLKLYHKNFIPKFSLSTKRNVLQTQPDSLQLYAKQTLCQLSQINIQLSKRRKFQTIENLPQITPWIQSRKDDNTQSSNTLPLLIKQKDQKNSFNRLKNVEIFRNRLFKQHNAKTVGYTTFIQYPSQKPVKTQGVQLLRQQIIIMDKANTQQNQKCYQSVKIFQKIKRQKRRQLLDDTKYVSQQNNPVLVKRKHQSLKAYNISNVSKEVEVLRNQIICNIQKQTVIPLNNKMSSINKNKSIVVKPVLRRKFSLRGKLNNSILAHQKENYLKQRQKQNVNYYYQTSNPLTKVLYHKYMKTVSKGDIYF